MNEPQVFEDVIESKAAWGAVVSLSLGVFGLVTAEFLPISLLTPMSQDLGISTGIAGQSVTMTAVVAAFAGPGVVIGTRNIDRRWTLLALTTMLIISSLLASFAHSLTPLLISRVLLGIGLGGFWAMSAALAMRLVPPRLMPRAMAVILTGVSVATVSAAPVGAWIGATLGWRAAFTISAGLGVLALAVQAATMPALAPKGSAGLSTFAVLLRRPKIQLALLTTLLVVAGHFAGFTYIRPFLEQVPKLGVEAISLVLLAFGIGGFFGNLAGGIVSERSTTLSLSLGALLISVTAFALVLGGATLFIAALAVTVWGFGFGAVPVSAQSLITRAAPDEAESAGALLLTTFQIAISSGAVLGGMLIEFQGPVGVFVFSGITAASGALLIASSKNA
ncbi:MFS transporter [Rhizobium sp. CFBP 8762]|uniref:MFS transporter n=1 Tax=Rhizobium sp. CFBP 8762 TaxID=2775279 RepID=UPI00177C7014|nr:MFS transporter [Rhizobium sp. CFBP 8762]MBD8554367.1 MFS transporter [Rhizobium sp. CFBP 8762]